MGQSAILQTTEYLSRATTRLPMNLRGRWYEHIDGRSDRSTLVGFVKWLRKRVETLFNPLEDFIVRKEKERKVPKAKPTFKINRLATTTETSHDAPSNSSDLSDSLRAQIQSLNKEPENAPSNENKCVIWKHKHPVAFFPAF